MRILFRDDMTPHGQSLFDWDEFDRWFRQAEDTLRSAGNDLRSRDFNWACFKAQQAAEYAVKALLRGVGLGAHGHSILKLLEELEKAGTVIPRQVKGHARTLDRHYIPPRYPNAYPEGSPFEFYEEGTAEEALAAAEELLRFVRSLQDRHA